MILKLFVSQCVFKEIHNVLCMYVTVTFTDETCDCCVRELYNICYRYELPRPSETRSTISRDTNRTGNAHSVSCSLSTICIIYVCDRFYFQFNNEFYHI